MVSAKDSLISLRINPLRLPFEVFRQRGRDVARAPVNADALRQTHQSRRQQCMICDVDRVAVCQSCFHLLGKDGCSREAANELKACFGALRRTAHVGDDLRGNIAVAPSNSGAAVHAGKDVGSVGYPAAGWGLARNKAGASVGDSLPAYGHSVCSIPRFLVRLLTPRWTTYLFVS